MRPRPRDTVRERLEDLSPAAFAAFVADLWRATGRRVEVEHPESAPPRLTVHDDAPRTYLVHHRQAEWPPTAPPTEADGVVSPVAVGDGAAGSEAPEVVGVDQLYDQLYYAIGRERCAELIETHLDMVATEPRDRSPIEVARAAAEPPAEADGPGRSDHEPDASLTARPDRSPRRETASGVAGEPGTNDGDADAWLGRVGVVAVVLGIVVVGGTLGALAAPFGGPGVGQADPTPTTDAPDAGRSIPVQGSTAGGATATPGGNAPIEAPSNGSAPSLPPGIGAEGITDATELAAAHGAALENRSFTVTITYRETVNGSVSGQVRETIQVAASGTYASRVETLGDPVEQPVAIAETAVFTNDTETARLDGGATDRGAGFTGTAIRPGQPGWVHSRLVTYVEWFLSVRTSDVVERFRRGNTTFYWVTIEGDPWPGVEDTTGSALIDEAGVVRELTRVYDVPGTDVSAATTIRITDLNRTTVEPPTWIEWNATDQTRS